MIVYPAFVKRGNDALVLNTGMTAPQHALTTIGGRTILIGPEQTNTVVLEFFATWCGPCRAQLPHLQEFWDKHQKNENLDVVVVGREQDESEQHQFRTTHRYTVDFASDPNRELFDMYFKGGIPRTVVIGPKGKIVSISTSPQNLSKLLNSSVPID